MRSEFSCKLRKLNRKQYCLCFNKTGSTVFYSRKAKFTISNVVFVVYYIHIRIREKEDKM